MYYSVACVNYSAGIRYDYRGISLSDSINCFAHNLHFALDYTFAHYVIFKQVVSVGKSDKATLHIIYRIQNILQIRQDFFISHKSVVLYD